MMEKSPYDLRALMKALVDGGVTCRDIRFFLGVSERTVKRHFKREKGKFRSGFHLNMEQKRMITELHHKGRDLFEIACQVNLPAKYVLKFITDMNDEGWTMKSCPACRRLVPARVESTPKPCAKCSRRKAGTRKGA